MVILDLLWNLAFVAVALSVLIISTNERPQYPLRFWVAGYAFQCLAHITCVWTEYKTRRERREGQGAGGPFEEGRSGGSVRGGTALEGGEEGGLGLEGGEGRSRGSEEEAGGEEAERRDGARLDCFYLTMHDFCFYLDIYTHLFMYFSSVDIFIYFQMYI